MSRSRTRFHAGRNLSQRVKPFEMFLGDIRQIRQDKKAAAGILGTMVSSIAWESTDDTVDLSGQTLANGEGSVLIAPDQLGIHYVKATTTYTNGLQDVDHWRLVVLDPDFIYVPPCPTLVEPEDGSILATETTVTLEWDSVARADEYRVYLWVDGEDKPSTPTATVEDPEYEVSGLLGDTLYHWSVDVVSGSQVSDGCAAGDFTTYTILCPALVSPANSATISDPNSVTLDWSASVGAVSYEVYLWADGDSEPATPTYTTTDTQQAVTGLEAGTEYHWKVVAVGQSMSSSGCGSRSFTSNVPGCPGLQIPVDGSAVGDETSTTLLWSVVPGADSYQVFVWLDGDPQPGTPTATTTDNTYDLTGLSSGTTYRWVVNSVNGEFVTSGCSSSTFTTDAADAVIEWESATFTGDILGPSVTLVVVRTGNSNIEVSADYDFTEGSALIGPDFVATPATVTFAIGQVTKNIVVPLVRDYDAEVLADAPWAYWKFDEASGTTIVDSSGNGRDLSISSGAFTSYSQPTLNLSASLAAYRQTVGTNISVLRSYNGVAMDGMQAVTVCGWVKFDTANPTATRVLFGIGGAHGAGQITKLTCARNAAGQVSMFWNAHNPSGGSALNITKTFTTVLPLGEEFWFEAGQDTGNREAFFSLNGGARETVPWIAAEDPWQITGRETFICMASALSPGYRTAGVIGKWSQFEMYLDVESPQRYPRWNLDAQLTFTSTLSNPMDAVLGDIDVTTMTIEAP